MTINFLLNCNNDEKIIFYNVNELFKKKLFI